MKKALSVFLALALVSVLTPMAFASQNIVAGDIYKYDDSEYTAVSTLTPGNTYYIAIAEYDSSANLKKAKSTLKAVAYDGKDLSLSGSLTIATRKVGSERWSMAGFSIKGISASAYPDDGYALEGEVTAGGYTYDYGNANYSICYEDGDSEITKDPMFFRFDDEGDAELSLPDGNSNLVINSKGVKTKVLMSMDTNYNSTIAGKYPNANLNFFNGSGTTFTRSATIYLHGNKGDFCYEINGNTLVDRTKSYNSGEDAFVFQINKLGSYIISNQALNGSLPAPASSSQAPTSPPSGQAPATNEIAGKLGAVMAANFSNKVLIVNYGTAYEALTSALTLRCKADMAGMNNATLKLYAYDQANNRLLLQPTAPYVGKDGYLYFKTGAKGYYVISSGSLAKK